MSAVPTFKKGDVVRLKSGGPLMTVQSFGAYNWASVGLEHGVSCVWFETVKGIQKRQEEVFDVLVLEKV